MLPAWLSRRRDVKKKQKQPGASPFLASTSSFFHQRQLSTDMEPPPASFAQALSLHEAVSRARDSLLEAELAGFSASRKDPSYSRPLSGSPNVITYASTTCNQHVRSRTHQLQGHTECTSHRSTGDCNCLSVHDHGVSCSKMDGVAASSMPCLRSNYVLHSTDGVAPKNKLYSLLSMINEHVKVLPGDIFSMQNGPDCPQDNDTEHSYILTPDSVDSSFGSDSSSAGSSLVRKCRLGESRQRLLQWSRDGVDEEALLQPCYLEHTHGLPEWQEEDMSENLECANGSILMVNTPLLVSQLEQVGETRKPHDSSGRGTEESDSLLNSGILHLRDLSTAASLDSTFGGTKFGCCSSIAESSGPMLKEMDAPSGYADLVDNMNCITNIMRSECSGSEGNGNSECKRFFGISYSKWEESSALIAAENPSLMLSSKWQEERDEPCSSHHKQSTDGASRESNACKYGEFKLSMCVREYHLRNGLQMCEQLEDSCSVCGLQHEGNAGCDGSKDDAFPACGLQAESNVGGHRSKLHDGSPKCALQDDGNVECHKNKHDAYMKHGRRYRGSSFSAALPDKLQGVVGDSVALVKMSHSPYEDFRQSMYEMIMEQDLEEGHMDVEELLDCYLTLNPPELHELIKEVFSDVWSSILMSVR